MGKKINISIVGTGLMGLQHIKAIQKSKKANLHSDSYTHMTLPTKA